MGEIITANRANNINFNLVIDRRNTNCLKYDFAVRRGKPENVLPLWVADMDFKVAPEIVEAIQKRTAHGIFGYSEVKEEYFEAIEQMAENAINDACTKTNPRVPTKDDVIKILKNMYE